MQKHYAYFSAAIRDGAKASPPAPAAEMFLGGATCALGAGLYAMGRREEMDYSDIWQAFPYMEQEGFRCPAGCFDKESRQRGKPYTEPLYMVVYHLYDNHKWTREAIADWLYAEEERLGFVTVVETQDYCDTRDNNLNQDSQASLPEKVFV